MATLTQTTQNVVEEGPGGKKYTVDPDLTDDDVIRWLRHMAIVPLLNREMYERYGCDEKRCKNLAYLPFIPRPPSQQHADYYNRKYALGTVVCLDHHTMRPARQEDMGAFKRGELKFLWLEWLREDLAVDKERDKILPYTQVKELTEPISELRRQRKISAKLVSECASALGLGVRVSGRKLKWSAKK